MNPPFVGSNPAASVAAPALNLARHVFGLGALALGVVTLAGHDRSLPLLYAAAGGQILGGAALQFRRTAKLGAIVLVAVFLADALPCIPLIVTQPQVYNHWGNFFEQFSLATGASLAYASSLATVPAQAVVRTCRVLFGVCTGSFGIEQAAYLNATAALVPTWLPPSQTFWAVATTAAFALAAAALLTNRLALPAARLLAAMISLFGVTVWIPLLLSAPHSLANWSEAAETFAIAGAAGLLAGLLGGNPFESTKREHHIT